MVYILFALLKAHLNYTWEGKPHPRVFPRRHSEDLQTCLHRALPKEQGHSLANMKNPSQNMFSCYNETNARDLSPFITDVLWAAVGYPSTQHLAPW